MRDVSLTYDPDQVFQRLVEGGFKLFRGSFDEDREREGHQEL